MKKIINIAFYYALAAMAGGVFYREFTKFNNFVGKTTLSVVHTHLFTLGMLMFLVIALYSANTKLTEQKNFKTFMITYNIGICTTSIMFLVRGILQVIDYPITKGLNASISGMAGIGHIITSAGIILLFMCLKKIAKD